ncbi:hypothetical protein FQN54_007479 [Arachnomyces sp. PD_36]|nr:hypothetical protein FQN54_007479 [Arachnomyces sp. PD_36]
MRKTEEDAQFPPSPEGSQVGVKLTTTTERKLLAKIDLHILPVLCVLYLLAFLDRVNISNAEIFGLREDLDLGDGTKYNTALTIFFVPYVLFEIPSNILLKKLKPHVWLTLCMFLFGLTTMLQGLVQNYSGLLATRFFLGLFETGMFPGCFYLMGMWYKAAEAQKRFSFFFSSTTLAGAFGGLLASAIGKMDHMRGYRGWRWVFILEGVLTCVVALFWYFAIPDFPEDVKWLNEEEREFIKEKLEKDVGKSARNVTMGWRDVLDVFKDFKIFIGGLMYFGLIVPAYGYAYFAPSIIQSYGYSPISTQLHSIAPWAAAFGFSMVIAYFSDFTKHRFAFAIFPICIAIVGFSILLTHHGKESRDIQFGALFLVTSGCYSAMPVIVCWFAMNLGGHKRRSVGTAWQIGFGNIGGIIATYSFLKKDGPDYIPGYSICIGFIVLSAASCAAYFLAITIQNRNRDRSAATSLSNPEVGVSTTAAREGEDDDEFLGDLSPNFRYRT